MQFAFIEDDDELRRVIEGGDFAAWRTFLHPEQRKYVEADTSGAFRLSGGAGTGKTVVAIHRARRLARDNPDARIILTTFNATLAQGLKADLAALDPELPIAEKPGDGGVYVGGHRRAGQRRRSTARATNLAAASERVFGRSGIEFGPKRTSSDVVWREVAQTVDSGLDAKLATPAFLETEYVAVVLANRITTLEQYAKVARPGRGVRLSRPQRIAVWKLVEAFRRQSQMDETHQLPRGARARRGSAARSALKARAGYLADHVIVDEAQDLHATHWALLRALVGRRAQRPVHRRGLAPADLRQPDRVEPLRNQDRRTVATTDAELPDDGPESALRGERAVRGGVPRSRTRRRDDQRLPVGAQRSRAGTDSVRRPDRRTRTSSPRSSSPGSTRATSSRRASPCSPAARMSETGSSADSASVALPSARSTRSAATPGQPLVMTMHRAKGMEFSRVILSGADDKHVPSPATLRSVPDEERAEALLRERSLLYVASSRARDALVVTWSGKRSELLG